MILQSISEKIVKFRSVYNPAKSTRQIKFVRFSNLFFDIFVRFSNCLRRIHPLFAEKFSVIMGYIRRKVVFLPKINDNVPT